SSRTTLIYQIKIATVVLDIPVQVSGSFSNPHIGLARWSADGRAMLAQSERLNALPAGVKQFAQRNACYRAIAQ
ncbi:hypothetical protein, partial [Acetobacter senegalensis]|uniref:hypothetical protein n=1 Tax=Acetobacter senegalensis TaxID=446692 RepID=UPI00264B19A1